MTSPTIDQLQVGDRLFDALFLLDEKQVRTTRNGNPYLSARLSDRTGQIEARYWNLPPGVADKLVEGQGVQVSGEITSYQDQLQIKIDQISYHALDARQFLPASPRPQQEMERELDALIEEVSDPWLRRLLAAILVDDRAFRSRFLEAPAAVLYHHACLGGLLEHSLGVAALAQAIAPLYPQLERDLLLTLALLHDLGKAEAYRWEGALTQSDEGRLLDHLYLGTRRVERAIDALSGFPQELRRRILHALLAHHGEQAAGSPVRPQTQEALALHLLDKLDAHIRGFQDHVQRGADPTAAWSEYSRMFQTRLYRGPQPPEDNQEEAASPQETETKAMWEEGDLPF